MRLEIEAARAPLAPHERVALNQLDSKLSQMSGSENEPYWTIEALRTLQEWQVIRALAGKLVAVTGWPSAPPPKDRAIYVGSDA